VITQETADAQTAAFLENKERGLAEPEREPRAFARFKKVVPENRGAHGKLALFTPKLRGARAGNGLDGPNRNYFESSHGQAGNQPGKPKTNQEGAARNWYGMTPVSGVHGPADWAARSLSDEAAAKVGRSRFVLSDSRTIDAAAMFVAKQAASMGEGARPVQKSAADA
jgi:hypothetical protein